MKILHWMKKENSGLARSTLEVAEAEERLGHQTCVKQPGEDMPIYGTDRDIAIECVHSQLSVKSYFNKRPKVMWMHGEPLSSVGNGISMKAICELAPLMDAFICMRQEELAIWQSIKRTWLLPKGINLNEYKPMEGIVEKLSGEPAVLYVENWRGQRNPLYLCVAMQKVYEKYPNARLHLYNCPGKEMEETFKALAKECKWWPFLRTVQGSFEEINLLYNRADIVVSCLYPLYARGIEAFGAGKALICPGYREHGYPWTCELEPESMANAIIECWENYDQIDYRKWATDFHDVDETAKQAIEVYERYT